MNKNHINDFINNDYSIIAFIETRFGDPITSLSINDDYVIFGTMLGRVTLYSFAEKKVVSLLDTSTENITGISILENSYFYISIGDNQTIEYRYDDMNPTIFNNISYIKNYTDEEFHNKMCDCTFTFLYEHYLFQIILQQPPEKNITITKVSAPYVIKNLNKKTFKKGNIEMTNYLVPFDFNLAQFVWVEFLTENLRNLCIYTFDFDLEEMSNDSGMLNNCLQFWKIPLGKDFGHISFVKLIKGHLDKIFIVRNLKICEIRKLNNFVLIYSFENLGDKIIDVSILSNESGIVYKSNNNINSLIHIKSSNQLKDIKLSNTKDVKILSLNKENNKDMKSDANRSLGGGTSKDGLFYNNNNDLKLSKNNTNKNFLEEDNKNNSEIPRKLLPLKNEGEEGNVTNTLNILFLDIDGNINLYSKEKIITLVNIYDIQGFTKNQRIKKFFSLGYQYIIKIWNKYITFSSDFGCFILKCN